MNSTLLEISVDFLDKLQNIFLPYKSFPM